MKIRIKSEGKFGQAGWVETINETVELPTNQTFEIDKTIKVFGFLKIRIQSRTTLEVVED